MQNLFALLRIESGALANWQSNSAAWNVEHTLSPTRLSQLENCIPAPSLEPFKHSLVAAAKIGYTACDHIAKNYGYTWPQTLAEQTLQVIIL